MLVKIKDKFHTERERRSESHDVNIGIFPCSYH